MFTGKAVRAEFDEYIQEKGLRAALVSNPEIEGLRYKIRGRSIELYWDSELKANTTYRIDCGNHIGDLNENNEYPHLEFVWSTEPAIDSLKVRAQLSASKPSTDLSALSVGLFQLPVDSNFAPAFVTRADKEGRADFNYLPGNTMALLAFEDLNFNRQWDTASERIAWGDTVTPYLDTTRVLELSFQDFDFEVPVLDTLRQDSLVALLDSLGEKEVGALHLLIPPIEEPLVVWMVGDQRWTQRFTFAARSDTQTVVLESLFPGNYALLGYFDTNLSGTWDGFQWNGKLPAEQVIPAQSTAVRAQWEVDHPLVVKAPEKNPQP